MASSELTQRELFEFFRELYSKPLWGWQHDNRGVLMPVVVIWHATTFGPLHAFTN